MASVRHSSPRRPGVEPLLAAVRDAAGDRRSAALLVTAALSLIVAVAQSPATVHQLYRDADTAFQLVQPQLAGGWPHGTIIDQGNHSFYEAWWFMRTTIGLPDHLFLWEAAPYVVAFVGILAVAWSAALALDRFAALLTAVALLAIGGAMRQVLFEPAVRVGLLLHLGVLCAALIHVWDRASRDELSRRRLLLLAAPLAAFTGAGATDQLTIFDGIVPFVLAPVIWFSRAGSRPARTVMSFAIATAIASALIGELLSKVMEREGVSASLPLSSFAFVPANQIGAALSSTLTAWVAFANGSFFGTNFSKSSVLAFCLGAASLLALAAGLRLLWRSTAGWWRERTVARADPAVGKRDLFIAFWGWSLVITLATTALSSVAQFGDSRYLLAAWAATAALLGGVATSPQARTVTCVIVALFTLVITGQDVKDGVAPPGIYYPAADVARIASFVEAHGATVGYAGYWDSHNFTWATRFRVKVFPVWPCPGRAGLVCERNLSSISAWFIPRPHTRTFFISSTEQQLAIAAPPATFGPPLASTQVGAFTVDVYGHDVAAQIADY